jgi:transglutaminase-like putative cysteine protease
LKAPDQRRSSRYVALCRAAGIPVRDIAFLLGITPQR